MSRRRVSLEIVSGIVLLFVLDAAIFRGGVYARWVDPLSRNGTVAQAIDNGRHATADVPTVLVLGDSRIGEGFSARIATQTARAAQADIAFVNGAVGSSTPRAWYYFLREHLQRGQIPSAVALMAYSYRDDEVGDFADRRLDIGLVHRLLTLRDVLDFPASFSTAAARWDALQSILLSGLHYKADVVAFLSDPNSRLESVREWRENGFEWIAMYPGRPASLNGLRIDSATGALTLPDGLTPAERVALEAYAVRLRAELGRPTENREAAAYRELWFNRIVELSAAHGIKVFIFRIPRGPLHFLLDAEVGADDGVSGVFAALRTSDRAHLLPAASFNALEQPEFFFDDLHLNALGRQTFSAALATALLPLVHRDH